MVKHVQNREVMENWREGPLRRGRPKSCADVVAWLGNRGDNLDHACAQPSGAGAPNMWQLAMPRVQFGSRFMEPVFFYIKSCRFCSWDLRIFVDLINSRSFHQFILFIFYLWTRGPSVSVQNWRTLSPPALMVCTAAPAPPNTIVSCG